MEGIPQLWTLWSLPNSTLHEKNSRTLDKNSSDFETITFPVSFPQHTSVCACTHTDNTDISICLYIIFSGSSCTGEILGIIKERILHAPADGIHLFHLKQFFFFFFLPLMSSISTLTLWEKAVCGKAMVNCQRNRKWSDNERFNYS